jgi:hypothetical protein
VHTIAAGNGTLSYTVTTTDPSCKPNVGPEKTYIENVFSGFSYTLSGVTTPLSGDDITYSDPNGPPCPPTSAPPVTFTLPGAEIVFTPALIGGNGTASVSGLLYPSYQVQSIIYDTPGNKSSNGFSNTETDGTTTTIGNSFTSGNTSTFSATFGFLFGESTLSWSYGSSTTTGNSTAVTNTVSDANGVSNATNPSGPNSINHQQDLFIIWLNPAVSLLQTGDTTVEYSIGTQLLSTGEPEIQDQVEVYAQAMLPSASNNNLTTVPVEILVPQLIDGQTLPGLANICAHPTYYPNSCTLANQCGCIPSDFTAILNQDPLLNYTSTESPLNADTSGPTLCTNPSSSASCRYVPIMTTNDGGVQVNQKLAGPQDPGGNNPVNGPFAQCDTTQTTQTYSESNSQTVGFAWDQSWKIGFFGGLSLKDQQQWTWTNSESTGKINSNVHCVTVTLSSSTVGCTQEIPIFEDTVYHTFVFQQPAGNTSCP